MKPRQLAIVIVSGGLLALIYLYFIIPNQSELQKLRRSEASVAQQVDVARRRIMQQHPSIDNSAHLLTDISILSQANHLNLQSVARLQEKNKMKLQLIGSYADMLMFMFALSQQEHPLSVSDFALKPSKTKELQLAIDLTMSNPAAKLLLPQSARVITTKNIFCSTDSLKVHASRSELRFPLQQIKMVGFMNVSDTAFAFVALPDGTTQQIEYGSSLGIEKARVIAISNNQIKLKNTDQTLHIITMQRSS